VEPERRSSQPRRGPADENTEKGAPFFAAPRAWAEPQAGAWFGPGWI